MIKRLTNIFHKPQPKPQLCSQCHEQLDAGMGAGKPPLPAWLAEGIRVRVNDKSGFHKGAQGVVKFIQPNGFHAEHVWVVRDGDNGPAWFWPWELEMEQSK